MEMRFKLPAAQLTEWAREIQRVQTKNARDRVQRAYRDLKERIPPLLQAEIKNTPEYQSLTTGILKHELGVVDAGSVLDEMARLIGESVKFSTGQSGPYNRDGFASLKLFVETDNSVFLSIPGATYISESLLRNTSIEVPWLRWLLESPHEIKVENFIILRGDEFRRWSRTGRDIMVPSPGGSWQIPDLGGGFGVHPEGFVIHLFERIREQLIEIILLVMERD